MKKKRFILALSFATICGGVWAQEQSPLLWPIKGQEAGTNILLRPQDLLDHETNYGKLVIGAKEGTEVIAPADGEVSSISLIHYSSLNSCKGCNFDDETTVDGMRRKLKADPNLHDPIKLFNGSISLNLDDGRKINVEGLRGNISFRSGERVKAGTVLGTVSYVYQQIGEPHIALSISQNRENIDPMTPRYILYFNQFQNMKYKDENPDNLGGQHVETIQTQNVYNSKRQEVPKDRDTPATERFNDDTPLSALFRENHHEEMKNAIESWRPYLINDEKETGALSLTQFEFDKDQIYSNKVYRDLCELDVVGALRVPLSQLARYLASHSNLSRSYATLYQQLKYYRTEIA